MVRHLASLGITPAAQTTQTLAEGLSRWVVWTEAISLSGVLGDGSATAAIASSRPAVTGEHPVIGRYRRVRDELRRSIDEEPLFGGSDSGASPPAAHDDDGGAAGRADHARYRRRYLALQRTWDERIAELRADVRQALAQVSPALRQLAALDAAMDASLAAHERRLLANVPVWLEKLFNNRGRTSPQDAHGQDDEPDSPAAPGRRANIGATLQRVLLAELELRLQPVEGMIEALGTNPDSPT